MGEAGEDKGIGSSEGSPDISLGGEGGDIAQERMRYQNNYACLLALRMYLRENNFIEIWSEHLNDILCKVENNKFTMIQVTTKVPAYPFRLNDERIKEKISAFVSHEKRFGDTICKYIIVTNCGISETRGDLTIKELLEYYNTNTPQKTTRAENFYSDLESRFKLTRSDVVKVLKKMKLWQGPGIYDIESRIKDSLSNIPEIKGNISIETRDQIFLQVRRLIEDTSSTAIKSVMISEPDSSLNDLLRNHKRVTKEMIDEIINKFWNRNLIGGFERIRSEEDLAKYYQVIPKNMLNIHEQHFAEARNRFKNMKSKSILILTGEPGVGKSWLAYRLMSTLKKDGYNPLKIRNTSRILFRDFSFDSLTQYVPEPILILDDQWISIGSQRTNIHIDDVCDIIKASLPSDTVHRPLPLIISLRRETWDEILTKLKYAYDISGETIEEIVENISLPQLDQADAELLVSSFFNKVDDIQPKYPLLKASNEMTTYIARKSQGNAVIIALFFEYVAKKAKSAEYTITTEDVDEILNDIVAFTLKLIFTYYFDRPGSSEDLDVISLLYLLANRSISIGHLKSMLESQNSNINSKLLSYIQDKKSLPLFELDDVGFLFPFHSCLSDAIGVLVNDLGSIARKIPKSENETLQRVDKIREQCVKAGISLRQECDKLIQVFSQSCLRSLNLYQENIEKEGKLFQTVSNTTLYNYLSNLIEFFEGDEEIETDAPDTKQHYEYFITFLENLKISYLLDEETITIQLFHIFRLLNLLSSPKKELREYYLRFLNSKTKSVSSASFPFIIPMLQLQVISVKDLESFIPSLFKLIASGTTAEDYLLGEIITKLIRGGVFTKTSKAMFLDLLKTDSTFLRVSSWAYVNALVQMKIITKEEVIQKKEYFLECLHYDQNPIIIYLSWIMVDGFLKAHILVMDDIIPHKGSLFNLINHNDDKVKNRLCYLLIILQQQRIIDLNEDPRLLKHMRKLLATDYLFGLAVIDSIPNWCKFPRDQSKYDITNLNRDKNHDDLLELANPNLHVRWMNWLSILRKLEMGEITTKEISQQKSYFKEMLSDENLDVRLKSWCIVPNLIIFGVFSIEELSSIVNTLIEILSSEKNYIRYLAWFTISRLHDFNLIKLGGLLTPEQLIPYESHIYRLPKMFPVHDEYARRHAFGLIDRYQIIVRK